jgi:beta propeller repeat protein
MMNLSENRTYRMTTNIADQYEPSMYGDYIVWQDERNGNWDIYIENIETHQQFHTINKATQLHPRIDGNKVVWYDDRNGNWDIYMGTIIESPITSFVITPRGGRPPLKIQFTDKSTNNPTSWRWDFGDGTYSTAKNPTHTYAKKGKYTVSLKASNVAGYNIRMIKDLVVVY